MNRSQAECFLPKDRERLLAVIEAGFGDFRFRNESKVKQAK